MSSRDFQTIARRLRECDSETEALKAALVAALEDW